MGTMSEALKIADDLELAAARLKGLGSNTSATERPSLDVQERFAAVEGIPEKPTPFRLDLQITLDEVEYCHARLNKLFRHFVGLDEPRGEGAAEEPRGSSGGA